MANATDLLRHQVIDHLIGVDTWIAPPSLYLGLCAPDPVPTSAVVGHEVSGAGYARRRLLLTRSGNVALNAMQLEFPPSTARWGSVSYGEVWIQPYGGPRLLWGELTDEQGNPAILIVDVNTVLRLPPGRFRVPVF